MSAASRRPSPSAWRPSSSTRDNVDILAGLLLTPNAMAGRPVSAEAKKFMVVMNAATSIVIDQVALYGPRVDDACRS